MKIKIATVMYGHMEVYQNNVSKIQSLLNECNGKATAHVYNFVLDILDNIEILENRLNKNDVKIKHRNKLCGVMVSGVPTSSSYARKGRTAIATSVTFYRGNNAWFITSIQREERMTGSGGKEILRLDLNAAAKNDVTNHVLGQFSLK